MGSKVSIAKSNNSIKIGVGRASTFRISKIGKEQHE